MEFCQKENCTDVLSSHRHVHINDNTIAYLFVDLSTHDASVLFRKHVIVKITEEEKLKAINSFLGSSHEECASNAQLKIISDTLGKSGI